MDKSLLRKEIREKKRSLTEEQICAYGERLCRVFLRTEQYRLAKSVYGYMPYNQEVRILPILEQALRDGKKVAVPKVYGDSMRFIWLSDLSRVAPGYGGIPEPVEDDPIADDPTALVILPGLAFDREGHRIGYGGGFYDRFLAREGEHPTVALCYDFQVYPHLETDDYDLPADLVIWA